MGPTKAPSRPPTAVPTPPPVPAPFRPPTPAPTQIPFTPPPIPTSCPETVIKVKIMGDDYGSETTWDLIDQSDGELVGGGGPYSPNQQVEDEFCLSAAQYKFTIQDSLGDGICCDYGRGNYEVLMNGVPQFVGGEFGATMSTFLEVLILVRLLPLLLPPCLLLLLLLLPVPPGEARARARARQQRRSRRIRERGVTHLINVFCRNQFE